MYLLFVLQLAIVEQLKAVFNMLLLNTGLHADTTVKFCHQVVLDGLH